MVEQESAGLPSIKRCHQNVTITCAQDGLEVRNGLQPNLILVDATMPKMNGYEFILWLMHSQSWKYVPVIVWTGEMASSDITRHYQAGANSVVLKMKILSDVDSFCNHWFELTESPQLA